MILIIDDDIAVRTSLLLLLRNEGFAATAAPGPQEALQALKKEAISLVILDLNFSIETSGKEGMSLLRQIRQVNAVVPVILITGWGTIELAVQGMKLGANDFINKPWSNDHLLQSIKTLLDLQDKQQEHHTRKQLDSLYHFTHIIGEDKRMLELLETGRRVYVVEEAVGSRRDADKALALARMRQAGAAIVSREMVAFEWLRKADSDLFREISRNFLR